MIKQNNIWTLKSLMLVVVGIMLFSLSTVASKAETTANDDTSMQLRKNIQITGENITLGDVFTGIGDAADVIIRQAPEPGSFMTIPLLEVLPIVHQYGLNWQRPQGVSRIRVERKSQLLNTHDLKLILRDAIVRDNGPNKFFLTLYGNFQNIHLPADVNTAEVSVNNIALDYRTGRFTTSLNLPMGTGEFRSINITGRIEELVSVPVLAQTANRDDIIGQNDVVWLEMPKQRLSQNILLDSDLLIGMAARRSLRASTPLRPTDIQEPVLIRKGTLVAMVISAGPMKISTIGRALQDGGKDDVIQIVNVDSHQTVEGRVVGQDNVEIIYHGNFAGAGQ